MTDKPRLIEVAFPLEQASVASVHEKNVRHGHISTLHIWPARRPLAASRAALLATLLPDPGNAEDRQRLLDLIGGKIVTETVTEQDEDGNAVSEQEKTIEGGVLAWGQENDPAMDKLREKIRDFYGGRAPKVLDPFAGGGAIPLEAMRLGCEVTASDLNPVAWFILKCTLEYPHQFAGKKWPLPRFVKDWPDFIEDFLAGKVKKRKRGDRPHFNDPKQHDFDDLSTETNAGTSPAASSFLPDADMAWQIRAWGRWVIDRARQDLASRYPVVNDEPPVAYLWARTARDRMGGRIPLLKTFLLCKKKGKRIALLPVPNPDGSGVTFKLLREDDLNHPERVVDENPHLQGWEITGETLLDFLKKGTMNRAGVWSPCTGRPGVVALRMKDDLPRQGQQGLLGTQMTAVVVEVQVAGRKNPVKEYRLPEEAELKAATVEAEELDEVFEGIPHGVPHEALPDVGALGIRVPLYGITKWREIFTPRQQLALGVFVKHTRAAIREVGRLNPDAQEVVAGALTIFFGRLVDYMSVFCLWEPDNGEVKHTFARYAFPITWDYAEANPLSWSARYYAGGVEVAARVITRLLKTFPRSVATPNVFCESSLSTQFTPQDIVFTDPPYYNAIPYSDLMDFFYIWQKRILSDFGEPHSKIFSRDLGPKWDGARNDGELVEDESRHGGDKNKAKQSYEDGMTTAFKRCCDTLSDDGRFVVVFANKRIDAWETLVGAMIRSGFVVSASWPIQTEMPNKVTQKRSNLASSVWIVCRKRPAMAQSGWDVQVFERMREILYNPRMILGGRNILQYYFDLGIKGPDFIWAALGPALEAYSSHPFVKKTEGGIMTASEFLAEVRKLVLHFALGELPGFHELQAQTQGRGESIELDAVTQYYLLHRSSFGLAPTPAGPCIMYAQACGKTETELKVVWNILEQGGKSKKGRPRNIVEDGEDEEAESSGNEFRLRDWEERAADENLGVPHNGQPAPLIDRLHRLMALFYRNQASDVQTQYEAWGLAGERAFPPLIQATRELAMRDRNDAERRLIEAVATQLKFTRRQVVEEGVVKDEPFFPAMVSYGKKD